MKKLMSIALILLVLLGIMFAEYRYIMTNITPYCGDDGTVYLEIFEQVDAYDSESWEVAP